MVFHNPAVIIVQTRQGDLSYINMKAIFDTNVLIDGFQDDFSAQARLIDAVSQGDVIALVTPAITREYHKILHRLISDKEYKVRIDNFLAMTKEVQPTHVDVSIDDKEDMKFLQAAAGSDADVIITQDRHLLDVGEIKSTRIVTPQEAWNTFEDDSDGGSSQWKNFAKSIGIGALIITSMWSYNANAQEKNKVAEEPTAQKKNIEEKETEITELNEKIQELQGKRDTTKGQADIITYKITILNKQLNKSKLELEQTQDTITKVQDEQAETENDITVTQQDIETKRNQLRELLRLIYAREQESLIRIFFQSWSLSDVLAERAAYKELQDRTMHVISDMREKEHKLEQRNNELEQQEEDMNALEIMIAEQKKDIAGQKTAQKTFLQKKKNEQLAFENLIKEAEDARKEIEKEIFTLQDNTIEVSLTSALDMAAYAGSLTGVRPAILLAVLKVESNTGGNIGSGKYPDDMHPQSRDAFVRIMNKLGLDPFTQQVSRKPASGRGWGGAMGPAQIMPATWEGIESRIEVLTKKSPVSPYELSNAFIATAIFLADRGAANAAQEREAVGKYIAGPNWQYYGWYVDKVMAVAKEYEKEGV